MSSQSCDLSIVIPASGGTENLTELLPQIRTSLEQLFLVHEILIVDDRSTEIIRNIVQQNRCVLLHPSSAGYGEAIMTGIRQSTGRHIIVMDADQAHPADFLQDLWAARNTADVIVSSRYMEGGRAEMPGLRQLLSKLQT